MDSAWKTRMSPPLALLVLAALTPEGHRVTLEDENIERPRPDESPDLVGITVKADTFPRACAIAAGYRARGIPVVFGGIHPTACPEDCAAHADAVVVGEAEPLWEQVVRDAQAGALRPRPPLGSPAQQGLPLHQHHHRRTRLPLALRFLLQLLPQPRRPLPRQVRAPGPARNRIARHRPYHVHRR
jgi:radical SAM superfamily enzyme YgiQ (UPF0313 family)